MIVELVCSNHGINVELYGCAALTVTKGFNQIAQTNDLQICFSLCQSAFNCSQILVAEGYGYSRKEIRFDPTPSLGPTPSQNWDLVYTCRCPTGQSVLCLNRVLLLGPNVQLHHCSSCMFSGMQQVKVEASTGHHWFRPLACHLRGLEVLPIN